MPTHAQTSRFRAIYDGFEHAGLRTELDRDGSTPPHRSGRVVRVDVRILDERGREVGSLTNMLATGADGLRARYEDIELQPPARGRGFVRALNAHAEERYLWMGVCYITLHAENVGSLLWPRLGFDLDLRHVDGETEQARRAHAVLKLLSPRARKVTGRPRPAELLAAWAASADPERRLAVAAMRARLPTPTRLAARELDGLLLDPRSLGDFDAGGTGLGTTLMLGASWDAYKPLPASDGEPAPLHERRP